MTAMAECCKLHATCTLLEVQLSQRNEPILLALDIYSKRFIFKLHGKIETAIN